MFDNGACIHRPEGCKEVYYFPPRDANDKDAGCSAFSKKGNKRIELLRAAENVAGATIDPGVFTYMTQESNRNHSSEHSQHKEIEPNTKLSITEQNMTGPGLLANHNHNNEICLIEILLQSVGDCCFGCGPTRIIAKASPRATTGKN